MKQLQNMGHTARYTFDDIISISPAMERIKKIAEKMAATRSSVLITGESGTGKELFAQAIHNASERKNEPFIALNCAALPENLLESELFGYEDGAFTGARKGGKPGLFESADKGTLFLDEVEGMSPMLQAKLLRVIQEQEVMRVGASQLISIDVRILAATNRDLEELVNEGNFREDLYYRLNTLPVNIPPLRERREDILPLMYHFMKKNNASYHLSQQVCQILKEHPFRGNIRELRNYAEYFAFLDKPVILYEDLPPGLLKKGPQTIADTEALPVFPDISEEKAGCYSPVNGSREKASLFVLKEIQSASLSGTSINREEIARHSCEEGMGLSVYEVRAIMKELANCEYIVVPKGRRGSRITEKGQLLLHSNSMGK